MGPRASLDPVTKEHKSQSLPGFEPQSFSLERSLYTDSSSGSVNTL